MEFKHRFYTTLQEEQEKGKSHFILHGNNIYYDLFFNNVFGVHENTDSLATQVNLDTDVKKIILVNDKGVFEYVFSAKTFTKTKIANNKIIETLGGTPKTSSSFTSGLRGSQREASSDQAQAATSSIEGSGLGVAFSLITKGLQQSQESVAVIVMGIEWIANLFQGQKHEIDYLKEIEKWWKISDVKHYTYVITKSYEEMKPYFNIEEDDDKLIYVGGPTIMEMLRSVQSIEQSGVDPDHLKKILKMVKNNGLSLRDFIYLYKDVRKELGDDVTDEDKLEVAIKAKLKNNISEEVTWDDVILHEETKKEIEDPLMKFQDKLGQVKDGSKGILFYGLPGTGKTLIAKALANKGGFFFSAPKLAELKGEYVGQSAPKVKKLFDEARSNSPTLMFLDELDSFFPKRGGRNTDSFAADITNQFLAELDGVDTGRQDIFVIGATNRIDIIDDAIMSRLSKVEIGLPHAEDRKKLFRLNLGTAKFYLYDEMQQELMVERSKGLSGRDIKSISAHIKLSLDRRVKPAEAIENAFSKTRENLAAKFQNSNEFDIILYDKNTSDGLDGIIGYESEKKVLKSIVDTIRNSKRFEAFGLSNYNGVLMYGPPGNGKTIFAKAVAKEFKLDFVKVIGSSLSSGNVNGAINAFETIVQNILQLSPLNPLLLFFDEFDGIAHKQIDPKFRSVMLDRINTLRADGKIIIMGATNFFDRIDDAVKRAGRFDEHLLFDNPTPEVIKELLSFFTTHEKFDNSQIDIEAIVKKMIDSKKSISISKVKTMSDDAKRDALMQNPQQNENILLRTEYFDI